MPAKHVAPPRIYEHAASDYALRNGISKQEAKRSQAFKEAWADYRHYFDRSNKERKALRQVARLERVDRQRPNGLNAHGKRRLAQARRQARENSFDRSSEGRAAQVEINLGVRPPTATWDVGDTP